MRDIDSETSVWPAVRAMGGVFRQSGGAAVVLRRAGVIAIGSAETYRALLERTDRLSHTVSELRTPEEVLLGTPVAVDDVQQDPSKSGLDLLPRVKHRRPDMPVFMISAYGDADRIQDCNRGV